MAGIQIEVLRTFIVRGTVYSPAGKVFSLPLADAVSAVESGRAKLVNAADRKLILQQVEADTRVALRDDGRPWRGPQVGPSWQRIGRS